MSHFTIEMLSDQCGVSMTNLRAWQRSGLLKPARNDSGKRYFDYTHLMRIHAIIKWLDRGLPLDEVARRLKGEEGSLASQWEVSGKSGRNNCSPRLRKPAWKKPARCCAKWAASCRRRCCWITWCCRCACG